MATAPAFAATPRIGVGHITAATPDLGTVTPAVPGSPATGQVTITYPAAYHGRVGQEPVELVTTAGVATGLWVAPVHDVLVNLTSPLTVTVDVATTVNTADANGWSSADHVPDFVTSTGYPSGSTGVLVGTLTGGAADTPASGEHYRDPTDAVTVLTGAAGGTKVAEVTVQATGPLDDPVVVVLWLHDGTTAHAWREVTVPAGGVDSATAAPVAGFAPPVLLLPDDTWSLRATAAAVPAAGELVVTALGGDL